MLARLALEEDRNTVHVLGRMFTEEARPNLTYSIFHADDTYDKYLKKANPTIFVVEHEREVVGFLIAVFSDYLFTAGFFISQELLYVRPDKRGSRAAALLIEHFNSWADRLEPEEVHMGLMTGYRPEQFARFLRRYGFSPCGSYFRRVVRGNSDG